MRLSKFLIEKGKKFKYYDKNSTAHISEENLNFVYLLYDYILYSITQNIKCLSIPNKYFYNKIVSLISNL